MFPPLIVWTLKYSPWWKYPPHTHYHTPSFIVFYSGTCVNFCIFQSESLLLKLCWQKWVSLVSGSALSKLFPSITKFDPRAESGSASSHRQKHKFVPKYSLVDVVMLKKFQSCIPKGECRHRSRRIKKVPLSWHMSPPDLKSKILEEFQCEDFTLLEFTKGRLFKGKDDELTCYFYTWGIVPVSETKSK